MDDGALPVTMPSLAPLDEYTEILRGVWDRGILTHNGPLVQELERRLCKELDLPGFVAVSSGTIALQMAIKALELNGGEIITTPFTWIATISAIQWEDCTPVFCDIDPLTLNMDPEKIAPLITPRTVAIMPVHVFGNPCAVDRIESLARQYGLKVIYDAAHAVGSIWQGRSLLTCGDISATSLHATKLLNTAEGGGCVTTDPALHERLKRIRFFGHDDAKEIVEEGFNGKMTEVHAALGLANLKYHASVLADRKHKYLRYRDQLQDVRGLQFQHLVEGEANSSYFPVILESEGVLLKVMHALETEKIHARRYFYPAVSQFHHILPPTEAPISEDVARRILCLPLYWKLTIEQLDRVVHCVRKTMEEVP